MRKLTASDMFSGIRILKKYGLRDSAKSLAAKSDTKADLWENGYEFVWELFDKLTTEGGEKDLYTFLSGPLEMKTEELKDLPIGDLFSLLKQLSEENDLLTFFRNAVGVMK